MGAPPTVPVSPAAATTAVLRGSPGTRNLPIAPRHRAFRTVSLPNGLPRPLEMPLEIKDIPGTRHPPLEDSTSLAADTQRRASAVVERALGVAGRALGAEERASAGATRAAGDTGITIKESAIPVWRCTLSANLSLARGLREPAAAFYAADRWPRVALSRRP
jgi:hypothetical protein